MADERRGYCRSGAEFCAQRSTPICNARRWRRFVPFFFFSFRAAMAAFRRPTCHPPLKRASHSWSQSLYGPLLRIPRPWKNSRDTSESFRFKAAKKTTKKCKKKTTQNRKIHLHEMGKGGRSARGGGVGGSQSPLLVALLKKP